MSSAVGMVGRGASVQFKNTKKMRNGRDRSSASPRVCYVSSSYDAVVDDPYITLKIQHNASETEVRKAFRKLALQYHPDVCRGSNCGVQFHLINEAYDVVMQNLREPNEQEINIFESCDVGIDEPMRGMYEPDYDLWEEWMGWEGAGIRDYSSHVNPYI